MTTLLVLYRTARGRPGRARRRSSAATRASTCRSSPQTPGLRATRVQRVSRRARQRDRPRARHRDGLRRPRGARRRASPRTRCGPRAGSCARSRRASRRSSSSRTRPTCWVADAPSDGSPGMDTVSTTEDRVTEAAPAQAPSSPQRLHVTSAFPAAGASGPVDGVALVTIDRQEVLNALSFDLLDELADELERLDGDDGVPGDRPHRRGDAGLRGRRRHQGARDPDADHADQSRTGSRSGTGSARCGRR